MELQLRPLIPIPPDTSTTWSAVSTYDGQSMSAIVNTAAAPGGDALVPNAKYRFRIRALNDYGPSSWSQELVVSIAPLPGQLEPPTKDESRSSSTSIMVRWVDRVPSDTEPVIGYRL